MGKLDGKVALVTGGASGIGAGCAMRLAEEGASVVITDLQDAKGEETGRRDRARPAARRASCHHDVTSEDAWTASSPTSRSPRAGSTSWSTTPASASARPRSP